MLIKNMCIICLVQLFVTRHEIKCGVQVYFLTLILFHHQMRCCCSVFNKPLLWFAAFMSFNEIKFKTATFI